MYICSWRKHINETTIAKTPDNSICRGRHINTFWANDNASSESDKQSGTGVMVDDMHMRISVVTICLWASRATYLVIQSSGKYNVWNSNNNFACTSPFTHSHVEYWKLEIFTICHPVGRVPLHVSLSLPYSLQSTSRIHNVGQGSELLIVLKSPLVFGKF